MCKNWVAIQESLPEEAQQESIVNKPDGVDGEHLVKMLMNTMSGNVKDNLAFSKN